MPSSADHEGGPYCLRCGYPSKETPCPYCEEEMRSGKVIPDDAPVDALFRLVLAILKDYTPEALAQLLSANDLTFQFAEDMMRGATYSRTSI